MAYIANKPVRFDRDYKVGEIIPDAVIAPSMTRKLVEMGRILHVDLPQSGGAEETSGQQQNDPQDGAESGPDGAENDPTGEDTGVPTSGEFVCEVCGRAFKTQNALAAHSRSHKD